MTRILAIDPGSAQHAVVVLSEAAGIVTYESGALVSLNDFHAALGQSYDGAILEIIEGYAYKPARVANMVLTARNEGRMIEQIYAACCVPQTCTAGEARGEFCRSKQASDEQVATVVGDLVRGAPMSLPKKERQHLMDACLYGLLLLRRRTVRLTLSAAGERALLMARSADHARAAAKGARTKANK